MKRWCVSESTGLLHLIKVVGLQNASIPLGFSYRKSLYKHLSRSFLQASTLQMAQLVKHDMLNNVCNVATPGLAHLNSDFFPLKAMNESNG